MQMTQCKPVRGEPAVLRYTCLFAFPMPPVSEATVNAHAWPCLSLYDACPAFQQRALALLALSQCELVCADLLILGTGLKSQPILPELQRWLIGLGMSYEASDTVSGVHHFDSVLVKPTARDVDSASVHLQAAVLSLAGPAVTLLHGYG